jgi:hypothetical protein
VVARALRDLQFGRARRACPYGDNSEDRERALQMVDALTLIHPTFEIFL